MRRSKFDDEQIRAILKEGDGDVRIRDIAHKHGISVQTFFRWRQRFGSPSGQPVAETMQTLRDENRRLRKAIADMAIELQRLKEFVDS